MREKETDEFSDTGFDQLVNSKNCEEEMIDENYDEEQMNLLLDGAESGQEVEEGELVEENESENQSANTTVNSSTQQRKSVFCPPSYPTKGFQFNMFNATSNGPIDFGGGMDVSLLSNNSSANTSGSGMLMANSPAMTAAEALRFHGPKNGQRPPIKPYTRIIDTVLPTTTKTKAFMDSFVPVKHQAARQKQIQMLRQQRDDKATKKADEGFDKQSSSHATASAIDGHGIGKSNAAAGHSRPAVQTASSHIPPRSPCFSQPNGGRRRLSDDFIEESASAMYCQQKRPRTDQSQPASEQFQQRSIRQAQEGEELEDHSEKGGSISAGDCAIRNSSSSDCSVVVLEQEEIKEERNAAMSPVEIGLGDEDQSGQENQAMQDRAEGVWSRNDPENEQLQNWLYYDHNFVRQWGFKGNEEDRAIVWVSGLRKGVVDGAFLHTHFSKFGAVRRIWLHNKPCVVAFVQFSTIKEAERAVADSDGRSLLGMCLQCGMDDEAEEYVVKKEECAERKSVAMSLPSTPKMKYANKNQEEDHSYCRQQSVSHARQQRQHQNDNRVYMRNQNRFNTAARGQPRGGDRVAPTRKNPTRREGSGFFFNISPDEPSNHVNAVHSSRHHHHSPSPPPRRLSRRDLFDTERSYRSRSMHLPARFQSRHESPSPPRVSGRLQKHQQQRSYHHWETNSESREEEEEQAHNSRARFGNGIQRKRFF